MLTKPKKAPTCFLQGRARGKPPSKNCVWLAVEIGITLTLGLTAMI